MNHVVVMRERESKNATRKILFPILIITMIMAMIMEVRVGCVVGMKKKRKKEKRRTEQKETTRNDSNSVKLATVFSRNMFVLHLAKERKKGKILHLPLPSGIL